MSLPETGWSSLADADRRITNQIAFDKGRSSASYSVVYLFKAFSKYHTRDLNGFEGHGDSRRV